MSLNELILPIRLLFSFQFIPQPPMRAHTHTHHAIHTVGQAFYFLAIHFCRTPLKKSVASHKSLKIWPLLSLLRAHRLHLTHDLIVSDPVPNLQPSLDFIHLAPNIKFFAQTLLCSPCVPSSFRGHFLRVFPKLLENCLSRVTALVFF